MMCCAYAAGSQIAWSQSEAARAFFDEKPDIPIATDLEAETSIQQIRAAQEKREAKQRMHEETRARLTADGYCEMPEAERPAACNDYSPPYSHNSVTVPRFAAPFQAQLINTEAFAPSQWLKNKYPNKALWELRHVCGATLIAPEWAVTAAHCFKHSTKPEHFAVRLDVGNIAGELTGKSKIKKIIPHPAYQKTGLMNDIALIEFEPPDNPIVQVRSRDGNEIQKTYLDDDKTRLAILTSDRLLKVIDIKRGKVLTDTPLSGGLDWYDTMSGGHAFSVNADQMSVRNLGGNAQAKTYSLPGEILHKGEFLPRMKAVVAIGQKSARLWRGDGTYVDFPQAQISAVTEAGPNRVDVCDYAGVCILRNTRTGDEISRSDHGDQVIQTRRLGHMKAFVRTSYNFVEVVRSSDGAVLSKTALASYDDLLRQDTKDQFVLIDKNSNVQIIDFETGRVTGKFRAGLRDYRGAAFHEDSRLLTLWSSAGDVEIWDTKRTKLYHKISTGFDGNYLQADVFDNGRKLYLTALEGRSEIWDMKRKKRLHQMDHSLPISMAYLSADKKYLIAGSEFGTAEIWSLSDGKPVARVYQGGIIKGAVLHDKNRQFLTWDRSGRLYNWDVKTGREKYSLMATRRGSSSVNPVLVGYLDISQSESDIANARDIISYGWGKTRPVSGMEPSAALRMLSLVPITRQACLANTSWQAEHLNASKFCAADKARKTCYGDSGGPVSAGNLLVGIISGGTKNCTSDGKPGLYTKVSAFKDWIKACTEPGSVNGAEQVCTDP